MLKSLSVRDKTKDFTGEMMSVICFKINRMPVFLSHFWFGTIPLLAYYLVPLKRRSPRCSYISISNKYHLFHAAFPDCHIGITVFLLRTHNTMHSSFPTVPFWPSLQLFGYRSISVSQDSLVNSTSVKKPYILTHKTEKNQSNLASGGLGFSGSHYVLRLILPLPPFPSLVSPFLCVGFMFRQTLSWWWLPATLSLEQKRKNIQLFPCCSSMRAHERVLLISIGLCAHPWTDHYLGDCQMHSLARLKSGDQLWSWGTGPTSLKPRHVRKRGWACPA